MKTKTILLHGPVRGGLDRVGFPEHYVVVKLTNSIEYNPKDIVHKKTVNELCAAKDWEVTITARKE